MAPQGRDAAPPYFTKDRLGLGTAAVLISVSVLAWAAVFYGMPLMTTGSGMMGIASLVPSLSLSTVGLFELLWVVGMAAMMFPAMIPIVAFYNRFATKAEPDQRLAKAVGTPLFLLGYLAVYAGLGIAVYLAVFAAVGASSALPGLARFAYLVPSALLLVAGVFQLTRSKSNFLMQCISPIGFFTTHSHRGLAGSLRMGVEHGEYCVGCCWAYMLVMFAIALMSVPFMAVLSIVIVLEKVVLRGAVWFTRAVAAGFVILGVAVLFSPGLLGALSAGL